MSGICPREFVFDDRMQQVASKSTKHKSESQMAEERLAKQYGVCAAHKRQKKKCVCNVPDDTLAALRGPQSSKIDGAADRAAEHSSGDNSAKDVSSGSSSIGSGFPDRNHQFQINTMRDEAPYVSARTSVGAVSMEKEYLMEDVSHPPLLQDFSWSVLDGNEEPSEWSKIQSMISCCEASGKYLEKHNHLFKEAKFRLHYAQSTDMSPAPRAAATVDEILPAELLADLYLLRKESHLVLYHIGQFQLAATHFLLVSGSNREVEVLRKHYDKQARALQERLKLVDLLFDSGEDLMWLSQLEERLKAQSWAWQDCSIMYDIDTANFLALAARIKQSAMSGPPERDKAPPSKYCTDLLAQSGFQCEIWEFYESTLIHDSQALRLRISQYKMAGQIDETVSKIRAHLHTAVPHIEAGKACNLELSSEAEAHAPARLISPPAFNPSPEEGTCRDAVPSSLSMRNFMLLQTRIG